jgi:hypothetical protein
MTARGWEGVAQVAVTGDDWPLDVAAVLLGMDERDVRDLVRICGLKPSGTMKMAGYARQGRHPRAYPRVPLIAISEAVRALRESFGDG